MSEEEDILMVKPLGAGREVGRSGMLREFKGEKILLGMRILLLRELSTVVILRIPDSFFELNAKRCTSVFLFSFRNV